MKHIRFVDIGTHLNKMVEGTPIRMLKERMSSTITRVFEKTTTSVIHGIKVWSMEAVLSYTLSRIEWSAHLSIIISLNFKELILE